MQELVIETQGLTKRYGPILAVGDLFLKVPRGGVFGLLGPNGSGKTTTMCMLLGLVGPTSGTIRLFGQQIEGVTLAALHRIGAIVESPSFFPYMTGRDNLRYFQAIGGKGSKGEVDRLLKLVELEGRGDSKFSTYSLGMKQRLGIAYALLGNPEMVFLDEPTNGLDPAGMVEMRGLIRDLGTDGRTVLLSSPLLHEVEQVCSYVAILSKGKLIQQGVVRDLLNQRGAIRLKTTDNEQAVPILSAIEGVSEVKRDEEYLIAASPPEHSWELTAALAAKGVYVSEMAPVQTSLEKYFLDVTKEPGDAKQEVTE